MVTPTSVDDPRHPPARWLILAGVWLIYFSFGLTVTGIAPLVAPIIRDLDMTHTEMGSILGAWQLVYIVSAIPLGIVVDWLRPRRALFIAAILIAGSGLARSFSENHVTMFFAVALFGFGGPMVSAGAPKVVSQWFRGPERGLAMGLYITGPALAGVLTLSSSNAVLMPWLNGDWRSVLRIWAAIALAAGVIWLIVSAGRRGRQMESDLRPRPKVPSLVETRSLLVLRPVQILLAISICIFIFNHGLNNWLPELLRSGGMSAASAGYWAAIPTFVGVLAALLIPKLATPERRLSILALLAIAAGLASLCLLASSGPVLLFGLILQGIARGSLMAVAILTLIELPVVGEKRVGTASGMFFSAAEIGGVCGPLAFGLLYDATGGFAASLHMLTGIAAILLAAVLLLRQSYSSVGGIR